MKFSPLFLVARESRASIFGEGAEDPRSGAEEVPSFHPRLFQRKEEGPYVFSSLIVQAKRHAP